MADSADSDAFISTLFKGSTVLFFGLVFELGISFIAKLLIARYLGRVDYGIVSLGLTTMSLATVIVLGGLYTGVGRYLPRYDDPVDRRGVLISSFQLVVPFSAIAGLALAVYAPWFAEHAFHDPEVAPVLRIFGIIVPAAATLRLSVSTVQGLQRSLPRVYIENFTLPLVRFLGIALVILLGLGAVGVAWAYLLSYVAAGSIGIYYVATRTTLFRFHQDYKTKRRELIIFSAPLVISTAMSFVFAQFDILLLGYFTTTGDVGVYTVIYPIAQLLTAGLASMGFIFMPVLSELHSDRAFTEMRQLYQTATKWLFTATLPLFLVFALFPTMTIKITFGPEYLSGAAALSVLAVAFFSHVVLGPNGRTLTSLGRTRFIMYVSTAAALLNLGLNLVLIPRYSFYGAALATAVSYVLLNVSYSYQLYRETGIHPMTRALVIPGAIGLVSVGLVYLIVTVVFTPTIPLLVGMFCLFMLVYGLAVLRYGIEREEVMLVLRFEDRFGVDLGPLKAVAVRFME